MVGRENHKENDLGTVNKLMYRLQEYKEKSNIKSSDAHMKTKVKRND